MHEHLDEVGVIHMNGRLYDPLIGRFMSGDPFIQSPGNLQSHNRYAYVLNNPLAYTDPSGHFFFESVFLNILTALVLPELGEQLGLWDADVTRLLQGLGVGFVTGQWALALEVGPVAAGAIGGFSGSLTATRGNLHAAVAGGLTGAMFGFVGGLELRGWSLYAGHALVGCVSAVISEGDCGVGASSGLFGKWVTVNTAGLDPLLQGIATTVAGGVAAELAGGKFANGAMTAAYGYLFNEMLSTKKGTTFKSSGKFYSGVETFDDSRHGLYRDPLTPEENARNVEGIKLIAMSNPLGRGVLTLMDGITIVEGARSERYDDALTTGAGFLSSQAIEAASNSGRVGAYSGWLVEKATAARSWFPPYGEQRNPHAPPK
ncbi:RHS repeat-associated core domain-containing protein [Hydrogenophaga borbori]|uniref:RHS repeat-associated core domain-containing protein n=1 Tax=Hydrogenophaga borbori TaxID=2294117 RepID=A0A372EE57_9BURK|nr:RHS repeat-associated core domain-containing protein [Hydrogenophaga borbori]